MSEELEGKVAIVTGGSRGIGKAIALQLGHDGAVVVVGARTEEGTEDKPGSIGETATAIEESGGKALAVKVDVTVDSDLKALVDRTMTEFGRIDILVNNAGALGGQPKFLESEPDELDFFYRTNLRAPYVLAKIVGVNMAEQGHGVIFNISSGLARLPDPPGSPGAAQPRFGGPSTVYGMTKAALNRFAAGVAAELQEKNIAIININPGFTLTERLARIMQGADTSRMERPETTAKAVAFLARDPMPYTGQMITARELADEKNL